MAGSRTYLPKLRLMLRLLCGYIVKYSTTIRSKLTHPNGDALLDAVLVACQALEEALNDDIPTGV